MPFPPMPELTAQQKAEAFAQVIQMDMQPDNLARMIQASPGGMELLDVVGAMDEEQAIAEFQKLLPAESWKPLNVIPGTHLADWLKRFILATKQQQQAAKQ